MELDLGPEVHEFRMEIREWIERNTPPGLAELAPWSLPQVGSTNHTDDREKATSDPIYKVWEGNLLAGGLICPNWPKEYGGRGLNAIEMVVFEEECQRAGVPRIERGLAERIAGPAILIHGTPEQKAAFLPRIVTGEDVYCQGYSEPDHGSDLAAIETRGIVDGDEVVITGHKTWTSGAKRANMIFILCRTDPFAPRHRGISYVLAPFSAENGIDLRPVMQLNGSSQFCEEFFDGTRAPLFNVIGGLNNGWRPAMSTLAFERGGKATILHLGFEMQYCDLAREVQARGQDADPLVRQQLAWAYT
jgi:alkylation response protein AidB-like acyl-CoA dehydrogenase